MMPNDDDGSALRGPGGFDIRAWLAQLPRYGWTADMIYQFPEPFRFEIIDGELLMPEWVWNPNAPIPRYE